MRRKLFLGTILMVSLLFVTVVAAIGTTSAHRNQNDSTMTFYGGGGECRLQLPPPGGSVAGHPTNLGLSVEDWGKHSDTTFDSMMISVWSPFANAFVPMASVIDMPIPAWWKAMWNGTFLYLEIDGVVKHSNLISVADKELEVWTESGGTTVVANLTVPVQISNAGLPAPLGLPTFTLPPTVLEIHKTGNGWRVDEGAGAPFPSGYVISRKYTEAPSWVQVGIKGWISGYSVTGTIIDHETRTATPPAS
jgi:hypothetical protein